MLNIIKITLRVLLIQREKQINKLLLLRHQKNRTTKSEIYL